MVQPLHAVSFGLCLLSFIFFLVGCIGFDNDEDTVMDVSWFRYDDNQWFGLRGFAFKVHGNAMYGDYSDNCNDDTCNHCDQDGKGAFALMIIALLLTAACAGLGGGLLTSVSNFLLIGNVIAALGSFLASLIAVSVFMNGCYDDIKDMVPDEDKLVWGPGSILSIFGMLLMLIVTLLQAGTWFGLWKC